MRHTHKNLVGVGAKNDETLFFKYLCTQGIQTPVCMVYLCIVKKYGRVGGSGIVC